MSIRITAYRCPSTKWVRMKNAWITCKLAGVEPPEEIRQYFDDEDPSDQPGMEIGIESAISLYEGGIQIDLYRMPENVRHIRVACTSYTEK